MTEHRDASHLLELIRAEYKEIPGLKLTKPQARRLWSLEPHVCDALLETLTATQFLTKTRQDAYVLTEHR
jgi:hypothetical protein